MVARHPANQIDGAGGSRCVAVAAGPGESVGRRVQITANLIQEVLVEVAAWLPPRRCLGPRPVDKGARHGRTSALRRLSANQEPRQRWILGREMSKRRGGDFPRKFFRAAQ